MLNCRKVIKNVIASRFLARVLTPDFANFNIYRKKLYKNINNFIIICYFLNLKSAFYSQYLNL
jgi:hypothetical protein